MPPMRTISKLRLDALAGYRRSPQLPLAARELAWFEQGGEQLLGVVSLDIWGNDYVSTVLGPWGCRPALRRGPEEVRD